MPVCVNHLTIHCTFITYVEVRWLTPKDTRNGGYGEKAHLMLWYETDHQAGLSITSTIYFELHFTPQKGILQPHSSFHVSVISIFDV